MSAGMLEKVESLVTKAEQAKTADEAMKLSQAALNAAHAIEVTEILRKKTKEE